jgi:hypothetical protein
MGPSLVYKIYHICNHTFIQSARVYMYIYRKLSSKTVTKGPFTLKYILRAPGAKLHPCILVLYAAIHYTYSALINISRAV